jgi:hypothetical protein
MKKSLLILTGIIFLVAISGLSYLKLALPNVGPPPDIYVEITSERLIRGQTIGIGCMDCHSERDYEKFAGPIKPGTFGKGGEVFDQSMGLPGRIIAPNITPYALKDWTDGEIYRAITAGVSKDNRPLFPIMPYHNFGQLEDEDLYSIIVYLRSLDPIEHTPEKSKLDFPMNLIVHTIPAQPTRKLKRENGDLIANGEYIFTLQGCGDCHTPVDDKGTPLPGMNLAGGLAFELPTGGILRTSNITPHPTTGIGAWDESRFISEFKRFDDSTFVPSAIGHNEYNTFMPWIIYSQMTEDELRALFAYLRSIPPVENRVTKFEVAENN